jgi:hypothetical protein
VLQLEERGGVESNSHTVSSSRNSAYLNVEALR